jgi:tetratricopeptide (TPR) repeat protein
LYELAQRFCLDRLEQPNLSEHQVAELTVELIRCHVGQALNANPQDRAESWRLARQVAADFLRRHAATDWAFLVRVQDVLVGLTQGQLLQQEAELTGRGSDAMEPALDALRQASRELEQLAEELAAAIPASHRRQDPGEPSADELLALQHHVRSYLARGCRIRGSCYPAGSSDRAALLSQAVDVIDQALRQLTEDDPRAIQLLLERAMALRLSGSLDEAGRTLDVLAGIDLPALDRDAFAAEAARWDLARGQATEALQRLDRHRQARRSHTAELDFAYLETLLALYRQASTATQEPAADSWRKQAVAAVGVLQQNHGPFWGRRADLALVHTLGSLSGVGDVPVLVRAGDDLYRKGQWDDAVATYEQAADAAQQAGDADQAFRLRYKAALVVQTRGRHADAASRLRTLASSARTHPDAAAAQLLAAWNLAQLRGEPPESLELYETTLREQAAIWPEAESTDQARVWLGRLYQSRDRWREAIEAYGAVDPASPLTDEAVRSAAACWEPLLLQATDDPASLASLAEEAAVYFEQRIAGPVGGAADWRATDRYAALQAAGIRLRFQTDGYPAAERVLRAALDGSPPPSAEWQSRARALLVVALSGQGGRVEQAESELAAIGSASPKQLLTVLSSVNALAASSRPANRADLAGLRLQIVQRLIPLSEQLDPAERLMLDRTRAEALRDSGQRKEALQQFADLAREYPDDLGVQEAYAQILLDSEDPQELSNALDQWRRVASRCRPRSDAWYRSRHAVALALIKLGRTEEATDRIRYLQITPPGLQDTVWQVPFQQLLERCSSRP